MDSNETSTDTWQTIPEIKDVPNFMTSHPTALDPALILPINVAKVEDTQRKLLQDRMARVLENLDLMQHVAEQLQITTDEVRRRYSEAIESLLDLVPVHPDEVSAVLKIVHIAQDDGDSQMTVLRPKRKKLEPKT
jgi:hypothetical protein